MSTPSSSPTIEQILKIAESLPPFPEVVWKVLPLVRSMAPAGEIEAVIKLDPVTTAKVLNLSQSPAFGSRKSRIDSLRDAILTLGQQQLIQLIMTASSARYYAGKAEGYDLVEGELWEHSVAVALMSEMVARTIGANNTPTVYMAALLHDIGKNVLNRFVKSFYSSILELVTEKKITFLEAERQALGVDHQQLGGIIATNWRFPPEIIASIAHHHDPQELKEHKDVASIVYVANRMVSALGIGAGLDGFLQPNHDEVFIDLGMNDAKVVDKLLMDLIIAMSETKQFLSS